MIRTTPFHDGLTALNDQLLYTHWSGYLSALRYSNAPKHEYFAVRNARRDLRHLAAVQVPHHRSGHRGVPVAAWSCATCSGIRPGRAAYTLWCDDRGFVMEDGVLFCQSEREWLLTSARPSMGWFADHRHGQRVEIEDVSDDYGMLQVQGPRSRAALSGLTPEVEELPYFGLAESKIGTVPVSVSRTGYTGDLGFELMVPADDAGAVLDALLEAGAPHGIRPFGEEALTMLRIEAGLPLVDIEFHDSRTAWTDHDRVTPKELGQGWMLKGVRDGSRRFLGSEAIRRELEDGTSRWATTGIVVDWADWDRLHRDAGRAAHQGRAAARLGAVAAHRRRRAGRLRHQLLLLASAAAAHRHGPRPARAGLARDRPSDGDDVAPHAPTCSRSAPRRCRSSTRARKTARP